jgi:hypothetical protein
MAKGTDKFFLGVIGGIVLVVLLCVCCIAALVLSPFGFLMKNGAQDTAKAFLKADPQVQAQVGTINSFGLFPQGSVSINNGEGHAELNFSLKGDKGEGTATVRLSKQQNKEWEVTAATLEAGGRTTILKGGGKEETPPMMPESAPNLPKRGGGDA